MLRKKVKVLEERIEILERDYGHILKALSRLVVESQIKSLVDVLDKKQRDENVTDIQFTVLKSEGGITIKAEKQGKEVSLPYVINDKLQDYIEEVDKDKYFMLKITHDLDEQLKYAVTSLSGTSVYINNSVANSIDKLNNTVETLVNKVDKKRGKKDER